MHDWNYKIGYSKTITAQPIITLNFVFGFCILYFRFDHTWVYTELFAFLHFYFSTWHLLKKAPLGKVNHKTGRLNWTYLPRCVEKNYSVDRYVVFRIIESKPQMLQTPKVLASRICAWSGNCWWEYTKKGMLLCNPGIRLDWFLDGKFRRQSKKLQFQLPCLDVTFSLEPKMELENPVPTLFLSLNGTKSR